jgi:hypothetical protein
VNTTAWDRAELEEAIRQTECQSDAVEPQRVWLMARLADLRDRLSALTDAGHNGGDTDVPMAVEGASGRRP